MIRFASRTDWSQTLNPLAKALEARRLQRAPILDLTESNPTRCGFVYEAEEILAALADRRSLTYSPDPRGLLAARVAVAEYYAERGLLIQPEQIFLTTSTSEAYSYVFRLLANTGDSILVPRPSYPLFDFLARLDGILLRRYPLAYDGRWHIDEHTLGELLDARARAILVVSPNNPTGSFLHQEELACLLDLTSRQSAALVADEVFADYPLEAASAGSAQDAATFERAAGRNLRSEGPNSTPGAPKAGARVNSLAGTRETLTFTLSGLSKISALPQMKVAWVVLNGPADALQEALVRLEVISDTYLSVSAPLAHALPGLLATRRAVQPQILKRVRRNLSWLDERLTAGWPVTRLHLEGGWYVILKLPAIKSDEEWAVEILLREGVLTHPGHFYDFPSESHLVISLLPQRESFEEGLEKILSASLRAHD